MRIAASAAKTRTSVRSSMSVKARRYMVELLRGRSPLSAKTERIASENRANGGWRG
jgi:hypothetical protein